VVSAAIARSIARRFLTPRFAAGYGRQVDDARIDLLLSTLNATDIGTLDSIAEKLREVRQGLLELEQQALADRAGETIEALRRGDIAEWKRGRAFLQSKIGHLR
jgi:hypothetical protein